VSLDNSLIIKWHLLTQTNLSIQVSTYVTWEYKKRFHLHVHVAIFLNPPPIFHIHSIIIRNIDSLTLLVFLYFNIIVSYNVHCWHLYYFLLVLYISHFTKFNIFWTNIWILNIDFKIIGHQRTLIIFLKTLLLLSSYFYKNWYFALIYFNIILFFIFSNSLYCIHEKLTLYSYYF
jgi:hypothetical protein